MPVCWKGVSRSSSANGSVSFMASGAAIAVVVNARADCADGSEVLLLSVQRMPYGESSEELHVC